MIEISGVVTREHYAEFAAAAYKRVNRIMGFWNKWAGLLVIVLTASVLGLISGLNNTPDMDGFGLAPILAGLCAGIVATALANFIYQKGFLAKFLLEDGYVLGPRTFQFSDDGMIVTARTSETRTDWRGLLGVSAHKSIIAVWYDPGVAFILPREAIGDETAVRDLVRYIEARIPYGEKAENV